ncbi:MAG: hypothetical protein Q8S75_15425, partial [Nitrospirota bacterium]|nr:hypothetical protein [Nitrospirota bacterium]
MSESHIAHAIATFSELGIATGLLWLTDLVKIRSSLKSALLIAEKNLRITRDDDRAKAKLGFDRAMGRWICVLIAARSWFYTLCIKVLKWLLQWSPYFCIGFGIFALLGISILNSFSDYLPAAILSERVYFIFSLLSFLVILLPVVVRLARYIV